TYRLRRDDKARALEAAHTELAAKCEAMEESLFSICEEAARSSSTCDEPLATMIRQSAAQFFGDRLPSRDIPSPSPSPSDDFFSAHSGSDGQCGDKPRDSGGNVDRDLDFGYVVHHGAETGTGAATWNPPSHPDHVRISWPRSGSPARESPLGLHSPVPPSTYSFHEATFARRLQRRSLELAYQVFDDPGADPQSVYRTFRLVPCFKDREKMQPYFRRLLQAGREQGLELYGLPFYCIGGAGKHYPRVGDAGGAETPPNLRLPRRILGIAPRDSSGDDAEACEESLARMGYGGIWLDSREV
ncbi:hypothetical protein IMZ48_41210, partial [Candidatus Bathyarchaeota archaeon]|nr:hypothetical protein [Candidatus Bathyarchaeota archaeon]